MRILIHYYAKEININSLASVPRLIASLIGHLEQKHSVSFFTFDNQYHNSKIKTKPVRLNISFYDRLIRKYTNKLRIVKKITSLQLKQKSVKTYLTTDKSFDLIITLKLEELEFLKKLFGGKAKILYWMHDVSAAYSSNLDKINYCDYLISPSITTYKEIQKKIQPKALLPYFIFIPNWAAEIFNKTNKTETKELRNKHKISNRSIVFVFSGGDAQLKGGVILQKIFKELKDIPNHDIVLFYIGGETKADIIHGNIRIKQVGKTQPEELVLYYNISNYGLLPSLGYDHAPLTLIEMINCGVVPLASHIGGIKEMLGTDYPFLIDIPNDLSLWKKNILFLINLNQFDRMKIIAKLNDRFNKFYSGQKAFQSFDEVINTVTD